MQITNEIVRGRSAVHSSSLMETIREALSGDRAHCPVNRPVGRQLEFQLQREKDRERERGEDHPPTPDVCIRSPERSLPTLGIARRPAPLCSLLAAPSSPRYLLELSIQLRFYSWRMYVFVIIFSLKDSAWVDILIVKSSGNNNKRGERKREIIVINIYIHKIISRKGEIFHSFNYTCQTIASFK